MTTIEMSPPPRAVLTCRCGAKARYWLISASAPIAVACLLCADRVPFYVKVRRMNGSADAPAAERSSLEIAASRKFVLDGREVREAALGEWARWLEEHLQECMIASSVIAPGIAVRTDFVGTAVVLFETMITGGSLDGYQARYRTYEEAEAGHRAVIELAQRALMGSV